MYNNENVVKALKSQRRERENVQIEFLRWEIVVCVCVWRDCWVYDDDYLIWLIGSPLLLFHKSARAFVYVKSLAVFGI